MLQDLMEYANITAHIRGTYYVKYEKNNHSQLVRIKSNIKLSKITLTVDKLAWLF